jgi:HSP20 family protein
VDKRRDLEHAAEEIEQLFADLWQVFPFSRGLRRGYRPQVDVYLGEDPPTLTVIVELPGVDPAGVRQRPKNCGHYQQMEIEYGPFQRQVTLATDIDLDAATATYERGILTVRLPVAPAPLPRESVPIKVKVS